MSSATSKPQAILTLEKILGFELDELTGKEPWWASNRYFQCNDEGDVITLNLSDTNLDAIPKLIGFEHLQYLYLGDNRITKIENLGTLKNLTTLNLWNTQISKIENLGTLKNLTSLDLSGTRISKIENLGTLKNLTSLDLSGTRISKIENLGTLKNLTSLNLWNTQISKIENLDTLENLTSLFLSGTDISKIENLDTLKNLTTLNLWNTQISKIENLGALENLTSLNLSGTDISKIENLESLINLTSLDLSWTRISKIENLESLTNLTSLFLSSTQISRIGNIEKLTALRTLNLSYAQIKSIDDLDVLPLKLENLDLRGNNAEIDVTNLNNFQSLGRLYVAGNTLVRQVENGGKLKCRLILSPEENNLNDIRRWLARKIEGEITPQVKVMLLGNHASGKSTFLDKLCETPVPTDKPIPSTHVLRVVKNSSLNANFYDFGGQDYYHGVYQAFNSSGALYLLFWQSGTDKNSKSQDSRQERILNFDRNYWLGQINYAIRQKRIEILDDESKGNVLVVQTHADRDPQRNLKVDNRLVGEEFYLALERKGDINETKKAQDQVAYRYLQLRIKEEITKLRDGNKIDVTAGERILYDFLSTNSRQDRSGYITIQQLQTELKTQGYEDSLACLMGELHQLYLQGEVLYYKDDKALRDIVWLDPEATVNHIHTEILKEKYIGQGGKVKVEDLTTATNKYLVRLLQLEKVIYQDGEEFIIPGYLPLADGDEMYEWLKLGYIHPDVTLKFEHFIPFGLINQLICYYGRGENELKKYWRDQLFFTLAYRPVHEEEEKESPTFPFMVWISLNHEHLTIEVYIKAIDERHDKYLATVRREIMEDILDMYWNNLSSIDDDETWRSRKSRHEYLRIHSPIDDLYISTYDTCGQSGRKLFAKLSEIDHYDPEKEENGTHISRGYIAAYPLTKEGTLEKGKPQGISLRSFRQLTGNKHIGRMKKIFISYSKQDEEDLGVCLQFLKPLEDKGYIQVYYDKLTGAGEFIHPTIRKEILDSDCMISLVSPGYLSTDYITKLELPLADKEGKTIFPFVIKPCVWEENPIIQGRYVSLKGETSGSEKVLFHGQSERYVSQAINHQVWKKFVEEFKKKVLYL